MANENSPFTPKQADIRKSSLCLWINELPNNALQTYPLDTALDLHSALPLPMDIYVPVKLSSWKNRAGYTVSVDSLTPNIKTT